MFNWLKKPRSSSAISLQETGVDTVSIGSASQYDSTTLKSLGDKHFAECKFKEAVACYQQAVTINPEFAEVYNNLGNVFREQGLYDEAEQSLKKSILIKPDLANAYYNLGAILYEQARLDEAMLYFSKTLEIRPDFIEAHNYKGIVFNALKKFTEAISCFQNALALKTDYADAHYNLGRCYQEQNMKVEALSCFKRANEIDPDNLPFRMEMLHLSQHICDWENLALNTELVHQVFKEFPVSFINLPSPFNFMSLPGTTIEEQKNYSEIFTYNKYHSLTEFRRTLKFEFNKISQKKINIGYISADFKQHPVSFLMAEVFELHDRSRFNLSAYSCTEDKSNMRIRLEAAFDNFVDIQNDSDEDASKKIYEDKIDILVDLTGHTQHGRTGILALRPSPIQVNYLGYPGTMGANFVDYLIADQFTIPTEMKQHYTENVVWMPDCFQANDRTRPRPVAPSREDCGLPVDSFVFCSFNQTFKITPEVFDIWCRLLKSVPGSLLWLPASNAIAEGNLRKEMERRGVAAEMLIMAPLLPTHEHLARLQCANLFLDTLPYNAGATCSDALWMGLPVITCAGNSFVSRMAGSLLTAIGAPELITYNLEDYYLLALDLATNRKKLDEIRNKIIANRNTSPLFDSELFTHNLENTYIKMIDDYMKNSSTNFMH